jgi:hypothetical protein
MRLERWGLRLGIPAAALIAGGVAIADPPASFTDGHPLTAKELNDHFSAIERRLPAVTAWVSYAPTITADKDDVTSSATSFAVWRRVGDTAEVRIKTTFDSCPRAGELRWSLPSGVVVDESKSVWLDFLGGGEAVGPGTANLATKVSVLNQFGSMVAIDLDGGKAGGATCASVGPGGQISMILELPVQGWGVSL